MTLLRIQANSVTAGTSDWRKKQAFAGSSPQARESIATPRTYSLRTAGLVNCGEGVIVSDEIKRLALFLKLDCRTQCPEIISNMQSARSVGIR